MRTIINTWLQQHPKITQWCWFVMLWVGGLLAVTILTYPIKWIIKHYAHG